MEEVNAAKVEDLPQDFLYMGVYRDVNSHMLYNHWTNTLPHKEKADALAELVQLNGKNKFIVKFEVPFIALLEDKGSE